MQRIRDDARPESIEVRGARVHNLRTSTSTCLWANWSVWPASPVRARARSHSACCMPKAHGAIWRRCPRTRAAASPKRAARRWTMYCTCPPRWPCTSGPRTRHTLHLRHDDRIAQQPASVVLTSRLTCVPALRARNEPTLNVAAGLPIVCANCGKDFHAPGAESWPSTRPAHARPAPAPASCAR